MSSAIRTPQWWQAPPDYRPGFRVYWATLPVCGHHYELALPAGTSWRPPVEVECGVCFQLEEEAGTGQSA